MSKDEALSTVRALKLALEALEVANSCVDGYYIPKGKTHLPEIELAITTIKEALAQPQPWEKFCDSNCVWTDHHPDCNLAEQEPVAIGEPVGWHSKQYGFVYMALQPHQFKIGSTLYLKDGTPAWRIESSCSMTALLSMSSLPHGTVFYTTPPQRTWVNATTWRGLTDVEIDQGLVRTNYAMQTAGAWRDGVEWAVKQLQERNT